MLCDAMSVATTCRFTYLGIWLFHQLTEMVFYSSVFTVRDMNDRDEMVRSRSVPCRTSRRVGAFRELSAARHGMAQLSRHAT